MSFDRTLLPEPVDFYESQGMVLTGKGLWQKTLCPFHDDKSPSLSVNTHSGGFYCFSCGAKGGDVLSFLMQRDGLDFIAAAKALGAWKNDANKNNHKNAYQYKKAAPLSAQDALAMLKQESLICVLLVNDVLAGKNVSQDDLRRMSKAAGRIQTIQEIFS
ncbi:MAG: CHC2 zinc finger domain-containing protein [Saezia sp.]